MTRFVFAVIAVLLATISPVRAQAKLDEEAVHNLPQVFSAAFNKHDGHQLAQMVADDMDFVTLVEAIRSLSQTPRARARARARAGSRLVHRQP